MQFKKPQLLLFILLLAFSGLHGQEEDPFVDYNVPSQNLLKFNRFLINPTFSTVREDKSYINLFHRNQSVSFDDNNQVYFLSYSGRVSDRSGVGLSLFTNREGLFNNFGVHANYAYGVRLSPKSNFTFGANFSYYQSAFNQDRANAVEDDPFLNDLESSSLISFQPGFNLSFGNFDIGGFAENLFDYNLKNSESVTEFNEKTYSGHLQYTHQFKNGAGILEQGRLMPLARVRKIGEENLVLGGNLILDLPKLGWVQAGYDDYYGASAGLGFNLNKNLSLGYTVEKGLTNNFENFGVTHEVSLAYSFTPNLTEDRVLLEKENEELVDANTPQENLSLTDKDLKIAELEEKLAENDAILDELLLRQDSIETTRRSDLEKRFETVMKMVRRETKGERPELEEKAKEVYFASMDSMDIITKRPTQPLANHGLTNTTSAKKVIRLNKTKKNNQNTSIATNTSISRDKTNRSYATKRNARFKAFSIPQVQSGHYLIANVFRNPDNVTAFVEKLREQGIDADYFENPKNGLNYVYLENFQDKGEAIAAHQSRFHGNYQGDAWIMNVDSGDSHINFVAVESQSNSKYADDILHKNVAQHKGNVPKVVYASHRINGLPEGYYIIANVFERASEANRFVKDLNAKGLSASYFINPEDNLRYVYLKKHQTWNNALTSYYSKLNASYDEEMWIMRVKPNFNS
ncbi:MULTISPECIES: PorP/SprF family type IX secretion system membrane protein [Flavobacteriaceae]|uniref:PorP/SprF family type IX secretion system membrane protein n=1 Tax=Flavobacteriaceae TaxID=49546 RepID=UPI001491665C|nr:MULTISPECIES: PorP/SprF family type IX secretion system membrane protein [Allomuricauda]MDC6365171.1 PorP/SprF family type IX secretion system membrane protein [Muricauda sp. AC10]